MGFGSSKKRRVKETGEKMGQGKRAVIWKGSSMTLEQQLERAVSYAEETGSFHKRNLIEQADHVCVYGLGKYFEDAFIRQDVRKRFHVDLLCDGNFEKVKTVVSKEEYGGLTGISIDGLKQMNKVFVIVMLGNPTDALRQIGGAVGVENCAAYNDVALDDVVSREEKYTQTTYFQEQKADIFKAFHLMGDDRSREIYVNVICNRIAPQFAAMSYEQMYQEPQYFPEDVLSLTEQECIVDGGAYTGDTLESFLQIRGKQFAAYHGFEMDYENYEKLRQKCETMEDSVREKICCHHKGLWDTEETLTYGRRASDDSYSIYNREDAATAETVSLDAYLGKEKITLIKMDIEGAEWKALQGARETIKSQKPKMAVCVYHRLEDIWKIPLFLKELVPEYKIALRHHARYWVSETVCYACAE